MRSFRKSLAGGRKTKEKKQIADVCFISMYNSEIWKFCDIVTISLILIYFDFKILML